MKLITTQQRVTLVGCVLSLLTLPIFTLSVQALAPTDKEIIKTGLNFGPLPIVAYDADRGLQYGAQLNIYNFDDGSHYPNPKSSWLLEASAYTKGSYKFILNYDQRKLTENIRMSACFGYYNDGALDFYGFGGYQNRFDMELIESAINYTNPESYKKTPKGFYRYSRELVKAKVDLTGKITDGLYWEVGYNFNWVDIGSFKPDGYTLFNNDIPGGTTLFDLYKLWDIIPSNQRDGGLVSSIRVGLMYDTRNIENNPTKGIWAETHLDIAPSLLGTTHQHFTLSANMRQYIPLHNDLVFAYRLAYQGFLNNDAPWYMMPFYTSMGPKQDFDGVGGYRTARGMMLNRVVAPHMCFYNAELRWCFARFNKFNQNIALTLSAFNDGAYSIKGYDLTNVSGLYPTLYSRFINNSSDRLHSSAGGGIRFIMNQNFIVACEYARCFNSQDGNGAFYLNTGFLF